MRRTVAVSLLALALACAVGIIISVTAASPATPGVPVGTLPPLPPYRGCPTPAAQAVVSVSPVKVGSSVSPVAGNCHLQPDGRSVYDQGATASPITGAPAITPSKPTNDPAQPAFTEAEARSYVAAHTNAPKVSSGVPPTVTGVTFETAQAVDTSLHTHLNLAPDRLLCVVTLDGQFRVSGPPLPPEVQTRVAGDVASKM